MTEDEFQKWQDKFYRSKPWMRLRDYIKSKYFGICQVCGKQYTYRDLIVHHKEPITKENCEDPNITLNEENLIPLCWICHNKLHNSNGERLYEFDANGNIKTVMELGKNDLDYLP